MEAKGLGEKNTKSPILPIFQLGDFSWEIDDLINQDKGNEKRSFVKNKASSLLYRTNLDICTSSIKRCPSGS